MENYEKEEIAFETAKEFSDERKKLFSSNKKDEKYEKKDSQSVEDYYAYSRWSNGSLSGKILGTIRAFINYVSSLIGSFVHNVIFTQHVHSMGDMYRQGYEKGKKENLKDPNPKENDRRDDNRALIEEHNNDKVQEEEIDPIERDQEASLLLSDDRIRKELEKLGIMAFPEQDSDRILLAFQNENHRQQYFGRMSKTELIRGKADGLAASIYNLKLKEANNNVDLTNLKLECAMEAVLATASISAYAYNEDIRQADKNGYTVDISSLEFEVPDGVAKVVITNDSQSPNTAIINYNGKDLCGCDLNSLNSDSVKTQIVECVKEEFQSESKMHHRIGNKTEQGFKGYEFYRNKTGKTVVSHRNGKEKVYLGTYSFNSVKDVKVLSDKIIKDLGKIYDAEGKSHNVDFKLDMKNHDEKGQYISGEVLAYAIAAMSNPSMKQEINEQGEYLNPITQCYEPGGVAHISISHDLNGVTFRHQVPEMGEHPKMDSLLIGDYINISSIGQDAINSLVSELQTAHAENEKMHDMVIENHIRIQDIEEHSPIISEEDAKIILQQNALDERVAFFTDRNEIDRTEMNLETIQPEIEYGNIEESIDLDFPDDR